MKDLQIDEEYLTHVKDELENTIELLQKYINDMINKEEDIFTRYKAFIFTKNINATIDFYYGLIKENLLQGKWSNHPIFKFEIVDIKHNPFFKPDEFPHHFFQEMEEEVKKRFEEIFCCIKSNSELDENNENPTQESKAEKMH